jgi:hypothetical protein
MQGAAEEGQIPARDGMSRTVTYQNCTIISAPLQDGLSNQWKIRITISWAKDGRTTSRSFWMPIACASEMEADTQGIAYGERIIDGKVPGLTLN